MRHLLSAIQIFNLYTISEFLSLIILRYGKLPLKISDEYIGVIRELWSVGLSLFLNLLNNYLL